MAGDDITGTRPTVEQLEQLLISGTDEDCCLYCIMDGFWADGLYGRLLNSSDLSWAHLFQGDVATRRVQQAPFIIALKRGHHLTRWLLEKGWGQGWGIYFTVSTRTAKRHYGTPPIHDKRFLPSNEEDIKLGNLLGGREDVLWAIRRHFRQFSDVILEDSGKIVDFRYYDPWVSYVFLSSSTYDEVEKFFGPVDHFIMDGYRDEQCLDNPFGFSVIRQEHFLQSEDGCLDQSRSRQNLTPYLFIRNEQIEAFQSAQNKVFFRRIGKQLHVESSLRNFRRDVSSSGIQQVYNVCQRHGLDSEAAVYGALVHAVVLGVTVTERTIQQWLEEKIPKNTIGASLRNYALAYAEKMGNVR